MQIFSLPSLIYNIQVQHPTESLDISPLLPALQHSNSLKIMFKQPKKNLTVKPEIKDNPFFFFLGSDILSLLLLGTSHMWFLYHHQLCLAIKTNLYITLFIGCGVFFLSVARNLLIEINESFLTIIPPIFLS